VDTKLIEVGWSRTDVTPTGPVSLWGQMHRRLSRFVRDPLTATVLALRGGGLASGHGLDHAVVVSCDLCGIDPGLQARLRARLAGRLPGLDAEAVVLCATHTHTGPTIAEGQSFREHFGRYALPNPQEEDREEPPGFQTASAYAELLLERLEGAVVGAWRSLEPALMGRALGHAVVGHNRRVVYADGTAVMYGKSARPYFVRTEAGSDHGVELLYTWEAGARGRLSGVVVNVACPSQVVEGARYVSADFWGAVRAEVARRLGADVHVLPLCGAAGDQSPRDLVRRNRGEPDMYGEAGLAEIGHRIADAVTRALPEARATARASPRFGHRVRTLELPLRRVTDVEAAAAREAYEAKRRSVGAERALTGRDMFELFPPIGVLLRHEEQRAASIWSTEVHAIRIGEAAVVTNPFELYLEYGSRMKARSPAEQTLVAQISGGWGGYLPTAAAVAGGGYGAVVASGTVGPQGGDLLVEGTLGLLERLWEPPRDGG